MKKYSIDQYGSNEKLGGKALGLDELVRMGYRVPDFAVVSFDEDIDREIVEILPSVNFDSDSLWAVRSSANIEDGDSLSFAGQFESFMGVEKENIRDTIAYVRQSVSSDRLQEYCRIFGVNADSIKVNVIVQRFEEPKYSGVWMSDTNGGYLEWVSGRGENLVDGTITPHKEEYDSEGVLLINKPQLLDEDGRDVASICMEIESRVGHPVDLEFCITDSGLQWVQMRAVTRDIREKSQSIPGSTEDKYIEGEPASSFKAEGPAYRHDLKGADQWKAGDGNILVTKATSPSDMFLLMTSNGVITELGGRLSHAAVVCRELGKACVTGVNICDIDDESQVFVDGSTGRVYLEGM